MKNIEKMSDRELRSELHHTRALLAQAQCSNGKCRDGSIFIAGGDVQGPHSMKCQWCAERSALMGQL